VTKTICGWIEVEYNILSIQRTFSQKKFKGTTGSFGELWIHNIVKMTSSSSEFDYLLKILVLGESGVGKSNLVLRYCDESFSEMYISTIGVDFKFKHIFTEDKNIKLQIWDTAGQERFRTITVSYYRRAHGVALVFDLTDLKSFQKIEGWMQEIKTNAPVHIPILLIGNKTDLVEYRAVQYAQAKEFADKMGLPYIETSAKTGTGVNESFSTLATTILQHITSRKLEHKPPKTSFPEKAKDQHCCTII